MIGRVSLRRVRPQCLARPIASARPGGHGRGRRGAGQLACGVAAATPARACVQRWQPERRRPEPTGPTDDREIKPPHVSGRSAMASGRQAGNGQSSPGGISILWRGAAVRRDLFNVRYLFLSRAADCFGRPYFMRNGSPSTDFFVVRFRSPGPLAVASGSFSAADRAPSVLTGY